MMRGRLLAPRSRSSGSGFQKLLFQIRIHPAIYRLVPELAVLRLQHPMAFIGEVEHFGRNLQPLQRSEELESLGDIQTVVELAVDHQRGRFELRGKKMWRPFTVAFAIGPHRVPKLPFRKSEFFRAAVGGFSVEHSVM